MHVTKHHLRTMPLHELIDLVEQLYLRWRFSGPRSPVENEASRLFTMAAAELDRRRRRALRGSCTCQLCMDLIDDATS